MMQNNVIVIVFSFENAFYCNQNLLLIVCSLTEMTPIMGRKKVDTLLKSPCGEITMFLCLSGVFNMLRDVQIHQSTALLNIFCLNWQRTKDRLKNMD